MALVPTPTTGAGVQWFAAGVSVDVSLAGDFNSLIHDASTFREKLLNQLQQQGLDVLNLTVNTQGLVERIFTLQIVTREEYTASGRVRLNASLGRSALVGLIRTATEHADSSSPTVTLTSAGEKPQDLPEETAPSVPALGIGIALVIALVAVAAFAGWRAR